MTTQPSLLDYSEQSKHLQRVSGRISDHIREFLSKRSEFRGVELHKFVTEREQVAPASCDRILREMRRKGDIDYVVVNRRQSLYKVLR